MNLRRADEQASSGVVGGLGAVPDEVLRVARRRFLRGERLEMGSLARELGVNRLRVTGLAPGEPRLHVEVLWSAGGPSPHPGTPDRPSRPYRPVRVMVTFLELVLANHGMQQLLRREIELAMRLLTQAAAGFQPRLLAAVQDLLEEESAAGRASRVDMDNHELAYIVVRVIESYTYLEVLLGELPDARRAEAALDWCCAPLVDATSRLDVARTVDSGICGSQAGRCRLKPTGGPKP